MFLSCSLDHQPGDSEVTRDATLVRQSVPPGAPTPLPEDMLQLPPEKLNLVASIRCASTEFAARHADDIRDIVQGEQEEMSRQLQVEQEEAHAAWEVLKHQVPAECVQADEERGADVRELEELVCVQAR
jgi:hypothetical protein